MITLKQKLSNTLVLSKSTPASKQPTPFPTEGDWRSKFVGSTSATPAKVYTGDKMLGIATMHKSNAVPVFSQESAKEIGKMK